MTQAQRKAAKNPASPARRRTRRKIEFIASVRFSCGDTELYSVNNAKTLEEARAMVLAEVDNVASLLVAERNWRH